MSTAELISTRTDALQTRDLIVGRGGRLVARLPDLSLAPGDAARIIGPSGAGKSTALFTLAGLLPAVSGASAVGGDAGQGRLRRGVGMIFQDLGLLAGLSVLDNVRAAAFAQGRRQDDAHARVLLDRLGLGELSRRPVERISRGEAQRVALARALHLRPAVILADEPTASLDDASAAEVAALLAEAAREEGAALLIATHDGRLNVRFPVAVMLEAA